jgi:hypothetical protein
MSAVRLKQLGFLMILAGMFAMFYGLPIAGVGVLVAFIGLGVFVAGRLKQ